MAEILRTPLEELILQIKILRLGQIMPFLESAIECPDHRQIAAALQCLRDLVSCTCVCVCVCVCVYQHSQGLMGVWGIGARGRGYLRCVHMLQLC